MSGICGICEPARGLGQQAVESMLDALTLPGEPGRQILAGRSSALGVARRWPFQQLAELNGVKAAADADITDFAPAAAALSIEPRDASAMNVAELIARLYLRRGTDFLNVLTGAFSIAIWDEKARRMLLAIDRVGAKSLYWRPEGERLLFASRAGAIRAVQGDAPEANPAAILQFLLFSSVPAPLSSDQGTQKLRPGTFLVYQDDGIAEHVYWDLTYAEIDNSSVEYWSRELRNAMRAAVHRNLVGFDQSSVGCYLSGGTDSSSVVAFAAEKHQPVRTFSIAFEESGFSEIEYARTTASAFRTDHSEQFLKPCDASSVIDKLVGYFDEPFANSSSIGAYYCAALARQKGVGTLLAGDGGDELFGGNERYATDKRFALYQSIPQWIRRGFIEPVVGWLPLDGGTLGLPRKYVRRANIPNPRRILSYGFFLSLPPGEIFEDEFLRQVGTADWLAIPEAHFSRAQASSELNRILYMDIKMTLADNDLRKVSGTAELAGVNVRYPLLDDRLAEFSGRIPARLKLKGFEKRYIFKQAMNGILPQKVLHKRKHGFGVPVALWLLQDPRMRETVEDVLHDRPTRQRGYFRAGFVEKLAALHQQQPNFYGEIVWYLVMLELWHRRKMEGVRSEVHAC